MTHTNLAAVAALDALATSMGLPAYSTLAMQSSTLVESLREGFSSSSHTPSEWEKAASTGWNQHANALWAASTPLRNTLAGIFSTNSNAPTTPAPRPSLALPLAQAQAIHASLCAFDTVARGTGRVLRFDDNEPPAHTRRVSVVVDPSGEVVLTAGPLGHPDFVEVHVNQQAFTKAYGLAP